MVKTDLIRTREAVRERDASVDGSRRQLVANINHYNQNLGGSRTKSPSGVWVCRGKEY
jgi:hypothetical protein